MELSHLFFPPLLAVEEKWPETQNWRHKGVVNARNYAEKIARKSGLYEDMLEEERMRFE